MDRMLYLSQRFLRLELLGTQGAIVSDVRVKCILIQVVIGMFTGINVLLTEEVSAT